MKHTYLYAVVIGALIPSAASVAVADKSFQYPNQVQNQIHDPVHERTGAFQNHGRFRVKDHGQPAGRIGQQNMTRPEVGLAPGVGSRMGHSLGQGPGGAYMGGGPRR